MFAMETKSFVPSKLSARTPPSPVSATHDAPVMVPLLCSPDKIGQHTGSIACVIFRWAKDCHFIAEPSPSHQVAFVTSLTVLPLLLLTCVSSLLLSSSTCTDHV